MYKYSYSKSLQQNSNSQDYKEKAIREVKKTNYRSRRCIRMMSNIISEGIYVFTKEKANWTSTFIMKRYIVKC